MSDYETKDNTGALFNNDAYKKTDKHPDLTGNIVIGGEKYYLSAWSNTSKAGNKYIKLSATAEQKQKKQDDDLPF